MAAYSVSDTLSQHISCGFHLSAVISLLSSVLGTAMLLYLAPLFYASDTGGRLFLRLVVFTIFLELPAAVIRGCSRFCISTTYPTDRTLSLLSIVMMTSAVFGRFLSTNMRTTGETVLVSVLLMFLEMGLRFSLVQRDNFFACCCSGCCGSLVRDCQCGFQQREQERDRANTRMWTSFMLLDTLLEDVAILLALPLSLLIRQPPAPGEAPLDAGTIVFRVFIQWFLELIVDLVPAIAYFVMARCLNFRTVYIGKDTADDFALSTRQLLPLVGTRSPSTDSSTTNRVGADVASSSSSPHPSRSVSPAWRATAVATAVDAPGDPVTQAPGSAAVGADSALGAAERGQAPAPPSHGPPESAAPEQEEVPSAYPEATLAVGQPRRGSTGSRGSEGLMLAAGGATSGTGGGEGDEEDDGFDPLDDMCFAEGPDTYQGQGGGVPSAAGARHAESAYVQAAYAGETTVGVPNISVGMETSEGGGVSARHDTGGGGASGQAPSSLLTAGTEAASRPRGQAAPFFDDTGFDFKGSAERLRQGDSDMDETNTSNMRPRRLQAGSDTHSGPRAHTGAGRPHVDTSPPNRTGTSYASPPGSSASGVAPGVHGVQWESCLFRVLCCFARQTCVPGKDGQDCCCYACERFCCCCCHGKSALCCIQHLTAKQLRARNATAERLRSELLPEALAERHPVWMLYRIPTMRYLHRKVAPSERFSVFMRYGGAALQAAYIKAAEMGDLETRVPRRASGFVDAAPVSDNTELDEAASSAWVHEAVRILMVEALTGRQVQKGRWVVPVREQDADQDRLWAEVPYGATPPEVQAALDEQRQASEGGGGLSSGRSEDPVRSETVMALEEEATRSRSRGGGPTVRLQALADVQSQSSGRRVPLPQDYSCGLCGLSTSPLRPPAYRYVAGKVTMRGAPAYPSYINLEDFSHRLLLYSELMAVRHIHAWHSRFPGYFPLFGVLVFSFMLYALRTYYSVFCPTGDPDRPTEWVWDFCSATADDLQGWNLGG